MTGRPVDAGRRAALRALALGAGMPAFAPALAKGVAAPDRFAGTPVGCAVWRMPLEADAQYRAAIRRYCDLIVPADALKWDKLRPTPDVFDFADADVIVGYARANGLGLRGHCLVWHEQVPAWLDRMTSRAEAEGVLREHIARVVGRYRGVIPVWDVVNELVDNMHPGEGDGLRQTLWLRLIGPGYIEMALRAAAAADPAAKLVLNEYFLEIAGPEGDARRAVMLRVVRQLLDRGAPLHAVGVQGHLYAERPIDRGALARFVKTVRALGLDVIVTELDFVDQKAPADPAVRDAMAASFAFECLDAVWEGGGASAILTWGITDAYGWTDDHRPRPDGLPTRPLPLDRQYRPKPLLDVVQHFRRWMPAGRAPG